MLCQLIFSVASFCSPLCQPGFTLPQPTETQMKLIQKLGDADFAVREETQKKLEKMDTEIYKALRYAVNNDPDPEIRVRAVAIISKVMAYNVPKELPSLFGVYGLDIEFKSGRKFAINKSVFLKYFYTAINCSEDSSKDSDTKSLYYFTYLLPQASHYLFKDMRYYGYSRQDIDELIVVMEKNYKEIIRSGEQYNWIKRD